MQKVTATVIYKDNMLYNLTVIHKNAIIPLVRYSLENDTKPYKYTCFNDTKEYLFGRAKDYSHLELPAFERGTMYRGMELCKEYTLEELGL